VQISETYRSEFSDILRRTFFTSWLPGYLDSNEGKGDLEGHISLRMQEVERVVLPWVAEVFDVRGKSILEIGCGTGSSTIPFGLQARELHAIEVSELSIEAARSRARLLGADNIVFHLAPDNWARSEESATAFLDLVPSVDVVLLEALLEHLTIGERLSVLRAAWKRLRPGGIIVIYETPNRLSHFDWHTFLLPFFDALPDELALRFASRTPRQDSLRTYRPYAQPDPAADAIELLYRLGRGVSYHEFELAIGLRQFFVLNDGYSPLLHPQRHGLSFALWEEALLELFAQHCPDVAQGFARPSLDLILSNARDSRVATHMHDRQTTAADRRERMASLVQENDRQRIEIERQRQVVEALEGRLRSVRFLAKQVVRTTLRKGRKLIDRFNGESD
jgi:S-adenosylmethionine-dependent methyltransferase